VVERKGLKKEVKLDIKTTRSSLEKGTVTVPAEKRKKSHI